MFKAIRKIIYLCKKDQQMTNPKIRYPDVGHAHLQYRKFDIFARTESSLSFTSGGASQHKNKLKNHRAHQIYTNIKTNNKNISVKR